MFLLIKNGNVFTPQAIGKNDVLVCAGKIVHIAEKIEEPTGYPTDVIDASGMSLTPGIVDGHIHLLGAGAAAARTHEAASSTFPQWHARV